LAKLYIAPRHHHDVATRFKPGVLPNCPNIPVSVVIGPIVASNDCDAIHLTAVHLKDLAGRFARVDTREQTGLFADFLQQSRLGMNDTVTTMSKGRRFLNRKENEPWVYGLAGHALS
jgi:hypothetical protein